MSGNPHTKKDLIIMDMIKGMWKEPDKKALYGQGAFMNLSQRPTIDTRVAEMNSLNVPQIQFGGLRDRIGRNRARQFGLLRNKRLKGLLA